MAKGIEVIEAYQKAQEAIEEYLSSDDFKSEIFAYRDFLEETWREVMGKNYGNPGNELLRHFTDLDLDYVENDYLYFSYYAYSDTEYVNFPLKWLRNREAVKAEETARRDAVAAESEKRKVEAEHRMMESRRAQYEKLKKEFEG